MWGRHEGEGKDGEEDSEVADLVGDVEEDWVEGHSWLWLWNGVLVFGYGHGCCRTVGLLTCRKERDGSC